MKAIHERYQLQAGPYCFVPDPWNDGMFHAPGGIQISEIQIKQLAARQKWHVIKINVTVEDDTHVYADLENT